jgi:hypothetical protein
MPGKNKKSYKKIPKYALQNASNERTKFIVHASPNTKGNLLKFIPSPIKKLVSPTSSNFSFFSSPNTGKSRCVDTNENTTDTYRHILSTGRDKKKIDIFMTETPIITKENIDPKAINIAPTSFDSIIDFCDDNPEIMNKPSQFSFEITRDSLVFDKRKYNQKNITHYTAKEFLELFAEKLPANKKYHLSHRRGHHLGGEGTIDNIDAGTAGSNFTTLCYIETTVHDLLTNGDANIITVTGDVTYDTEYRCVVRHIDYCVFADGIKLFTKRIEHLEHRKPRIEEHGLALGLAEFMISSSLKEQEEEAEEDLQDSSSSVLR